MFDKIICLSLIVLVLSSCGADKKDADIKTHTFTNETNRIFRLTGKWTVVRTTIDSTAANCNACPTIEFTQNNTAILRFPNNRIENYSWEITSDTLTLLSTSFNPTNSTTPFFSSFKYKMKYMPQKDFLELRLSSKNDLTYELKH